MQSPKVIRETLDGEVIIAVAELESEGLIARIPGAGQPGNAAAAFGSAGPS